MLKLISARKMSSKLSSGDIMQYIPLPELPYEKLKTDFAAAPHLAAIDALDLKGAGGVLIKCHCAEDGLLAASYLYKKLVAESASAKPLLTKEDFDDEEHYFDDNDDEDDDEEDAGKVESILYKDNRILSLPVIPAGEFANGFMKRPPLSEGFGFLNTRWEGEVKVKEPYWMKGEYPLIVEDRQGIHLFSKEPFEHFEQAGRFLIYISTLLREPHFGLGMTDNINHFEKTVLFETSMEYCSLEKPSTEYFEKVLTDCTKSRGYKLSRALNKTKLVKDLIDYRGSSFRSCVDIETFVAKAINKKRDDSKTITKSEFECLFAAYEIRKKVELAGKSVDAASELEGLIGLGEVKSQLMRLVKRMKFDKQRRNSGYKTADAHAAAVFMGSPGTAKTTVARIFGKLLCEENVLTCNTFMEVARKDLVGKFVGWTAPTVARVFEEAKGGTIFIDEAYSLAGEGMADGYSEEALAEIIRQMENNPDTLVIFAGYSDKMKRFIQNANPGLRSRLTNVIEFTDYAVDEMCRMFSYFMDKEEYLLEQPAAAEELIRSFVNEIKRLPSENMGNGRLIRKLFKAAVGHMADRDGNDLRTLMPSDIEKAAAEILQAELSVSQLSHNKNKIGFH